MRIVKIRINGALYLKFYLKWWVCYLVLNIFCGIPCRIYVWSCHGAFCSCRRANVRSSSAVAVTFSSITSLICLHRNIWQVGWRRGKDTDIKLSDMNPEKNRMMMKIWGWNISKVLLEFHPWVWSDSCIYCICRISSSKCWLYSTQTRATYCRINVKIFMDPYTNTLKYKGLVNRSRYFGHGSEIMSHIILWYVITYSCFRYLPLVPKSPYIPSFQF